jgi:flagellar hook assembly protein FlgD
MEAGEYRIYTTQRLTPPDITTDIKHLTQGNDGLNVEVFPNPVLDKLNLTISSEKPVEVSLQILDVAGRVIIQQNTSEKVYGTRTFQFESNNLSGQKLTKGIYFIKVRYGQEQQVIKIVKQ